MCRVPQLRLTIYHSLLTLFDHLPRRLQNLVGGAESPLADLAEHLREFEQTRVAVHFFDAGQGAVFLDEFLHLIVLFAEGGQLRQVGDAEDLVIARQVP